MRTTEECLAKAAEAVAVADKYTPGERTHDNLLIVARTWLEEGRRAQRSGPDAVLDSAQSRTRE